LANKVSTISKSIDLSTINIVFGKLMENEREMSRLDEHEVNDMKNKVLN